MSNTVKYRVYNTHTQRERERERERETTLGTSRAVKVGQVGGLGGSHGVSDLGTGVYKVFCAEFIAYRTRSL